MQHHFALVEIENSAQDIYRTYIVRTGEWSGMEALGRVELPTNGLGNRCSIHLSYRATSRNRLDAVLVYRNGELRIVYPIAAQLRGALNLRTVNRSRRLCTATPRLQPSFVQPASPRRWVAGGPSATALHARTAPPWKSCRHQHRPRSSAGLRSPCLRCPLCSAACATPYDARR